MENNNGSLHILMVPWVALGHITPMLQLAQAMESLSADFHITIAYSARAYATMQQSNTQIPKMDVRVIEDGINPDPHYNPSFSEYFASFPVLQVSLEKLVEEAMAGTEPFTCIISGTFCTFTQPVCQKYDIPRVEIWPSLASNYSIGFYHHILASEGFIPVKGKKEDTLITCIPGLQPIKASDFPKDLLPSESELQTEEEKARFNGIVNAVKGIYGNARDQYRILVNTLHEIESAAFDALLADGVKACAIGPLFLYSLIDKETRNTNLTYPMTNVYKEDETCLKWLDGKPHASVLYVAFGSLVRMSKDEIQELAYGLEECGENFLWVIRPGSTMNETNLDDDLPTRFRERTSERGIHVPWAPQTSILAHPSIGGFLTHCGWNSTLEALSFGVPMLTWPRGADQRINKKFIVEDLEVGLALDRYEVGNITRGSIHMSIKDLMRGDEGVRVREKVKEIQNLMLKATQDGGSSRKNLDLFIADLRALQDKE